MAIPPKLLSEHAQMLDGIVLLAIRDLLDAWDETEGTDDAEKITAAMVTAVEQVTDVYGEAAGVVAADWYDEARSMAGARLPRFRATPTGLPPRPQIAASTRWAMGSMWSAEPNRAVTRTKLAGSAERLVRQADRQTILAATMEDPAKPRYARQTSGGCPFCQMLASRGAVYAEESSAFHSHDHCKCTASPVFTPDDLPEENQRLATLWDQVVAGRSGPDAQKAWAEALATT